MSTKSVLDFNALKANKNIAARSYWKLRMANFELENYFDQKPAVLMDSFNGHRYAEHTVKPSEEINETLERIATSSKAKHLVLLSALGVLIQKCSGVEDVCIFTPLGFPSPDNSVIPIRIGKSAEVNFKTFLAGLKENVVQDVRHGNYPIERIFREQGVELNEFSMIGMLISEIQEAAAFDNVQPNLLFSFDLHDEFLLKVRYHTGKFNAAFIKYLAETYLNLLDNLIHNLETIIMDIVMLPEEVHHDLVEGFNATSAEYPKGETILTLFEKQALKAPKNIALRCGEVMISYKALDELSDQIAFHLREAEGVEAGDLVGLMLEREKYLIPVLLGILKAGAAYVPLDPGYPIERIKTIIEDAHIKTVVSRRRYWSDALHITSGFVDLDTVLDTLQSRPSKLQLPGVRSHHLAYVIYTSGSTGKPKGVMIEHGSLLNYIYWSAMYYVKDERATFPLYTSISFDLTVTSIFTPLITGNEIILYEGEEKGVSIERILAEGSANVIKLTPSHLKILRDSELVRSSLKSAVKFIVGGEELETRLAKDIYNKLEGRVEIYNEYGPTEATVGCMIHKFEPDERLSTVPIGVPINNTQIYILDKFLKPLPLGVSGEMYISGEGVAQGYLMNEDLTREKFIDNPFIKGARMYKTGDRAVRQPDGIVLFKGRMDDQVKIRGFRIELGEMENQLSGHRLIKETTVVAKEREGEKYLVAYYVSEKEIEVSELNQYLKKLLPDYMIPSFYVWMERFPLTPNGKLDKRVLPDPEVASADNYAGPANEIEQKLVQIWSEVLKLEEAAISVNKSFFELGGNSLRAIVLANKIFKTLKVKISLKEFFEHEHIRSLGNFIEQAEKSEYSPIRKVPSKPFYKVSSAQKRLYFLYELNKTSLAYHMQNVVMLEGDVDRQRFDSAFYQLISRHESLRTSFEIVKEEPVQMISESVDFEIEYFNSAEDEVQSIIKKFKRPFDLKKPPLIRVGVIAIAPQRHVLIADIHHIIADGVSLGTMIKDFMALYNNEKLSGLHLQYKDYAEWQQSREQQEKMNTQKEFWMKEFSESPPVLDLPTDFARPAVKSHEGHIVNFEIGVEETDKLKSIAEAEGATVYMVLLSVYNILLSKLGNQEDIVVGTSTAGRQHADLENIIGMFVNMLTLRNYPKGNLSFREFLSSVKSKTLSCFENQTFQYERLIDELKPERDTSRNPLFDVMFDFQNLEASELKIPGLVLKPYKVEYTISKFDITLTAAEADQRIFLKFEYSTALFEKETIERFITYFRKIVSVVITDSNKKIADIAMLPEEVHHDLVEGFNATSAEYPKGETILTLFEKQALKAPENIALRCGEVMISYKALDELSDQIAFHLREAEGVEAGDLVGLMLEREKYLIPVLLGILKAGAAYVPLDPGYPIERIKTIIEDAHIKTVVSRRRYWSDALHITSGFVDLDTVLDTLQSRPSKLQLPGVRSHHLAYVIYTSGSTGKPKGVMIEHGSLLNYIYWSAMYYVKDERATFPLYTSISFDLTVTSIFTPLITGNEIILYEGEEKGVSIERILAEGSANVIKLTPSHLKILRDSELVRSSLKSAVKFIVGGEELETRLAKDIYNKLEGRVEIYNEYGPTEATVGCMIHKFEPDERLSTVPIGVPINNTQIYILDKFLKPLPLGVSGEMYISGEGVAQGYLMNEDLTQEKFIDNPFIKGARMYKTGDRAVRQPDGIVLFKGRMDDQVKIRGFRIELGEMENQLSGHRLIKETTVVAKEREGEKYLVAYYVSEKEIEVSELNQYLKKLLPDYMIPSFYVWMERFPLTPNGKLDKRVLPDPEVASADNYAGPANEIEQKLVQIWSEVLKLEEAAISVNKSFFELGGHSLKAIELANKILKELGVEILLDDVFEHTDILSQCKLIEASERSTYASITKAEPKAYYALSPTQKGMYFLHEYDRLSLAYNMPRVIKLEGGLNNEKLVWVFNKLIERHEIFRTSFEMINGEPAQVIADEVNPEIEYFQAKEAEVRPIMEKLIRPFDLQKAPLLRVGVVEINPQVHFLMVDIHHIIMDGTSYGILIKEFAALYSNETLPPQKLQYKDYTAWQQGEARADEIKKQNNFWVQEFSDGIPTLELPTDFTRPLVQSHEGSTIDFNINTEETRKLKSIAEAEGATLYMALLTVYNIMLAKLSGQDDIVVGTSIASRNHDDLKNILGLFLDTLPLRNYPKPDISFKNFLKEIKSKTLRCFDNHAYDYEAVANQLNIKRNVSHNAFFDVMFMVQNHERSELIIPGLMLQSYSRKGMESKFDLTLTATEYDGQIFLSLEYCTRLFRRETIERFIVYFKKILSTILSDANTKISSIEIITEKEKHQILYEFNPEKVLYSEDKTIVDLFEEQVKINGTRQAILFKGNVLTYEDLNSKVNQVSRYLIDHKRVRSEDVIALYFNRSAEMIIALLAVLKAGASYLPIDPNYPISRVNDILTEAQIKIILSNTDDNNLTDLPFDVIHLDKEHNRIRKYSGFDPHVEINSDALAYIIYTSGSTGYPKGIQIEHKSLLDYAQTFKTYYSITKNDKVIQQSSLTFDTAVEEIFPALISGALIIVMPNGGSDIDDIVQAVKNEKATVLSTTPLVLNELNGHADHLKNLRVLISGGDILLPGYINNLIQKYALYNTYGPAESTVCITYNKIEKWDHAQIIGKPIRNRKVFILNGTGGLCPVSVKGEICVSGIGLARGYVSNITLTNEKFIVNPHIPDERMYRTGDLGRWLPDGNIEFLGRIDNQVKIRGFRIELSEIEIQLSEHHLIDEAVVAVKEKNEIKYLVAYYVSDTEIDATDITNFLQEKLPDYMVPANFVHLQRLPLTSSGKIDKKSLPDVDPTDFLENKYVAPRTEIEMRLVEIWRKYLGVERIGIQDNFFMLGGHSLSAMRIVAAVKNEMNVHIPIKTIYKLSTVVLIAQWIELNHNESVEETENYEQIKL